MKKLFLGLAALFLLLSAKALALDTELSGTVINSTFNVTEATAGTATVDLVAAVVGKFVKPTYLLVMSKAANEVTIKCGSTTKLGPLYLPATTNIEIQLWPQRIKCATGEALKMTKSATGDVTVFGHYTQE